jgi:hypothetical protein
MKAVTSFSSRHLMIANACSLCQNKHALERTTMKISPRIATAAVAVLALGGAGAGTAMAANHSPASHTAVASAEATSPDNDNIQSGDQTGPDNNVQSGSQTGSDSASTVATMAIHHQKAQAGGENGPENNENAGESSGPSDGPGGYADPSGNAQHEFDGVE